MNLSTNSAYVAYAITCIALSGNLVFLWAYSGGARNKARSTLNPEDASRFNSTLAEAEPPGIARWLHSWAYLGSSQPLRTIFFVVAGFSLLALMGHIAWLVLAAR